MHGVFCKATQTWSEEIRVNLTGNLPLPLSLWCKLSADDTDYIPKDSWSRVPEKTSTTDAWSRPKFAPARFFSFINSHSG